MDNLLEDRILICWKSAKSSKLRLSVYEVNAKEWISINMQTTPEFRLGSGSVITRMTGKYDIKTNQQDSENTDEVQLSKQNDDKDTPRLLILGGILVK